MKSLRPHITRLEPADFSFHGFEDLIGPLERVLRSIGLRTGQPTTVIVEHGVFMPAARVPAADRADGRFAVEGGIVTPDGRSLEGVQVRRRGTRWGDRILGGISAPAAVVPAHEIDDEVVYLGWYFDQFGHFLLESLARTWILEEVEPSVKFAFHMLRNHTPEGTRQRILEAFGISADRVLILDKPTRIRRLIVPEPLYEISANAHVRMPDAFRRIAERLVGAETRSGQPVYLSRRLLPSDLRQVIGEDDLEEVLRENGFLIAHPETMTFEDQLRLINCHADIFTSTGSAVYGILFALDEPRLHLLSDGVPREDYFLVPRVAGLPTTYVNCLGRGHRAFVDNRSPLLAENDKLVDYLEAAGFLKRQLRASLVRRGQPRHAEYDEAWFYAAVRDVTPHGEALPDIIERDASAAAARSWPVSLALARYYLGQDDPRFDEMAMQFATLASTEFETARLARYHKDVEAIANQLVKRCGAATVASMGQVLADRFLIELPRRARSRHRTV